MGAIKGPLTLRPSRYADFVDHTSGDSFRIRTNMCPGRNETFLTILRMRVRTNMYTMAVSTVTVKKEWAAQCHSRILKTKLKAREPGSRSHSTRKASDEAVAGKSTSKPESDTPWLGRKKGCDAQLTRGEDAQAKHKLRQRTSTLPPPRARKCAATKLLHSPALHEMCAATR